MATHLFCAALYSFSLSGLTPGAALAGITDRIHDQQERVHAAHLRLQQKRAELDAVQQREHDLQHQLAETNTAISSVRTRLVVLADQLAGTERQVTWERTQLRAAQASLKLHDDIYRRHVVQIYEHGNEGYLEVLLTAKSFSDFVERWEDLRLLIAADQRAIAARKAAARRVAVSERRVESASIALLDQTQAQQQANVQLEALSSERRELVAVADSQRLQVAAQVAQMEELSAQEEAALQNLIVERERELEAKRRAAQIAGRPSGIGTGNGEMIWPVSGPITSPFGWRMHPIYRRLILHEGIDIGVPTGTPVKAADAGRVIIAGWVSGYGNYVAIDHGGGVSSGYGHMSRIFVSVGQDVAKGQVIGAAGSTGNSTGPHVHFEVRVNGQPVDPLTRLHP